MTTPEPPPSPALSPHLPLLYRDGMVLIVDKPAGLTVHPNDKVTTGTLVDLLDGLRFGLPHPPQLAHRLDRDTSGCLVLGRHRKALARLGELFSRNEAEKTYWAVVTGQPPTRDGVIDRPLRKRTLIRGGPQQGGSHGAGGGKSWRMEAAPFGASTGSGWQDAQTAYRVLGSSSDGLTWLELKPATGRTHQLRVHCQALGCPILGDPLYGRKPAGPVGGMSAGRVPLHLHARQISLPLNPRKPPITATAPVPPHMRAALAACGWTEAEAEAGAGAGAGAEES